MSEYVSKIAVLEWLKEQQKKHEENRNRLEIDHPYWEYHEGASDYLSLTVEKIESGAFDAPEEVQRLRAALEQIANYERDEYESDLVVYAKCKRIAIKALSSTEPTGVERAKAAIADRYKNALRGWLNPVDRAAGSYYNGYLNGVGDTLRLLDITIPGINAPEGDDNDAGD